MASQRFAHRMHGVDSAADRSLRAQLAHNIALEVAVLRLFRDRMNVTPSVELAREALDQMIAERAQRADAGAMGVGHA